LFKLRKIIKKEKPDILHCILFHANIIGRLAAVGLKCKVISSIRAREDNKPRNLFDKITQGLVDVYTTNSNALKDFVQSYGIDKNKIKVIENGIDFTKFKNTCVKTGSTLISVANLRKQKDYPTLLRALAIVQKKREVELLIVGSGTDYEDEAKTVTDTIDELKLKNVKLLGYRKDVQELLSTSNIWISSTLYEGQSNSLLEAMMMKKTIITTDIPENSEVVRNEKEALLVPIQSPEKMADAIMRILDDKHLAFELATAAYNRVQKYDINNTINELETLYRQLYCDLKKLRYLEC
jgi:glycosyltransferase involved in cell wall biosynthesis